MGARQLTGKLRTALYIAGLDIALVLATIPVLYLVTLQVDDAPADRIHLTPGLEIYRGVFGHSSGLQVLGNLLLLVPLFAVALWTMSC